MFFVFKKTLSIKVLIFSFEFFSIYIKIKNKIAIAYLLVVNGDSLFALKVIFFKWHFS